MSLLTSMKYSFQSRAYPEDTFTVINFHGTEGLSEFYWFEINLVTKNQDLDLNKILEQPAVFTIHRENGNVPFHGILAKIEIRQAFEDLIFYQAVLAPKFWWLTLTRHNQVFLDAAAPDIIKTVLESCGLTSQDYEMRLQNEYPTWEYVCQYRESHFDFVSRWLQREGMYYFFEQTDSGEKLIITDTKLAHTAMPFDGAIAYSQPSGLEADHMEEVIQSLICSQAAMPRRVIVKDYNYQTPSLDLSCQADVSPEHGRGEFYYYGDHYLTPEDGERLASIRAESLLCRERIFSGSSRIPFFRPGYSFDLTGHFMSDFNQKYLTISMEHGGNQAGYLIDGLSRAANPKGIKPFYSNKFKAIEAEIQFRAEINAAKPRFYGTITAQIDAEGAGHYAELDDQGRYKVILPFDRSGRSGGRASAWIRMMQPYTGSGHGMHFPLHKGTEVLLTFMDGDPDRPVIAGAVPNPDNPSLLASANAAQLVLQSSSGNQLVMGDTKGQEFVGLYSPHNDTAIGIGSTKKEGEESGEEKPKLFEYTKGSRDGFTLGDKTEIVVGTENKVVGGVKNDFLLGVGAGLSAGATYDFSLGREFVYEGGNTLAMGPGSRVNLDESSSVEAIDEVKLNAVRPTIESELMDKAMTAAKGAAAACAALAASISGIGHDSGGENAHSWLADKTGSNSTARDIELASLAPAAALLAKCQHTLETAFRAFKEAPAAVSVELSKKGMDVSCQKLPTLTSQPGVSMVSAGGVLPASPAAQIDMDEKSITLSQGTRLPTPKDTEVSIDAAKGVTVERRLKGKVVVDDTGVLLTYANGPTLRVGSNYASMRSDKQITSCVEFTDSLSRIKFNNSQVKITASGISLLFPPSGTVKAGLLQCVGNKLLKLG